MNDPSTRKQPESTFDVEHSSKPKGKAQKICLISAYLCAIFAVISAVFMYLKVQELGASDPISASFLASFFFFTFTGVSLGMMAKANLPNLSFYKPDN